VGPCRGGGCGGAAPCTCAAAVQVSTPYFSSRGNRRRQNGWRTLRQRVPSSARVSPPLRPRHAPSCRRVVEKQHSSRDRSMTYFRVNAHTDAQRRRRRFNVGGVLVLNNPSALSPPDHSSNAAASARFAIRDTTLRITAVRRFLSRHRLTHARQAPAMARFISCANTLLATSLCFCVSAPLPSHRANAEAAARFAKRAAHRASSARCLFASDDLPFQVSGTGEQCSLGHVMCCN